MPPEETVKARYLIYSESQLSSRFDPAKTLRDYLNEFIGKPNALASAVKELTSPQDTPAEKVAKIYKAVQERIRNLSYEETYTKQERKRENIKERKSAQDVWRLGYGTEGEIVFLFTALCRAAGLIADPMGVIQRDGQFYDPEIPRIQQINGWLVAVDLPGGAKPFDPGVRFAPVSWVSWQKQGVRGIRFGADIANVDLGLNTRVEENQLRRNITLALQADGSADVRIETTYSGEDAVDRRNDFFDLPKDEREQLLRDELKEVFPSARIQEITWDGMDDASNRAKISYRFALAGVAQILGTRIVLEPRLFKRTSPFPNWNRTHPVYLRRSIDTIQEVRIVPPAGYQLENSPESKDIKMTLREGAPGLYVSSTKLDGNSILHSTKFTTLAVYILIEDYMAVKRFYDQVAASERTHIILRKQ